jgi:hypothetical protein
VPISSRLAVSGTSKWTYGDYLDTNGNVHGQVVQENQRVEQVIEEELQAWVFARNPTPQSRVAESMTFRKRCTHKHVSIESRFSAVHILPISNKIHVTIGKPHAMGW